MTYVGLVPFAMGAGAYRPMGRATRKAGRTWWVPMDHEPWPLRAAEIIELSDELVDASTVRPAGDRLRALFSPGVRTRFGRPRTV